MPEDQVKVLRPQTIPCEDVYISLSIKGTTILMNIKKISYSTSLLMSTIFCRILASREAVPVLCLVRNPWRLSWYTMTDVSQKLIISNRVLHNTQTSLIPNNIPSPLGRSTTVYHVYYSWRSPFRNAVCMVRRNFRQWVSHGESSLVIDDSKECMCSTCMPGCNMDI